MNAESTPARLIPVSRVDQLVRRERERCDRITSWINQGVDSGHVPAEHADFLARMAEDIRDSSIALLAELGAMRPSS